jgi:tetratricopeptide (TPR) repeat protein
MRFRLSIVVALACFAWLGWTIAQKPAKKRDYDAEIDSILKDKKFDEKLFILDTMEQSARLSQNWSALAAYAANRAEVLKGEEKYDEALRRLDSTLVILRKAGLGESEFAAKLWVWKAVEYRMKQEWINTRNAYQTAIRLYEKNKASTHFWHTHIKTWLNLNSDFQKTGNLYGTYSRPFGSIPHIHIMPLFAITSPMLIFL